MKRILTVDDEELFRSSLRSLLEDEGYECEEAQDGVEALHILRRLQIDLVITDLRMPNMDGRHLLQTMEESDQWKTLPVICVTGNLKPFPKDLAMPVTILRKPIDTTILLVLIQRLLPKE